MGPPARKKAAGKKVVRKPAVGAKARGVGAPQTGGGAPLAGRIVTAPKLIEPKVARVRVSEWLAGLPAAEAKPLKARLAAHPTVNTLLESLAESSPYLWE
jgi:hypothetical protein